MRDRVAIGVGCRRACATEVILAVIQEACVGLDASRAGLFTIASKRDEAGLHAAAAALGLPLTFVPAADLAAVAHRVTHRSSRVATAIGVPSVAEAAALVGAGPGSRLVVARIVHAAATCAVAVEARR